MTNTVLRGKTELSDLADVELEAVVELGRTTMPLAHAMQLKAGDVIALPKLAGESYSVTINGQDRFVVAWENTGVEFASGLDGVPEPLLAALPVGHVNHVGFHAMSLFHPDRDEEKNSASPSSGPSTETSSTAGMRKRRPRSRSAARTSTGGNGATAGFSPKST